MSIFSRTNIPPQVEVIVFATNVRSGPSTSFTIVGKAYKGQKVECVGKINSWWVVHLENDTVGLIYGPNARPAYPSNLYAHSSSAPPNDSYSTQQATTFKPSADAQEMLDLVNSRRAKEGLRPLRFDAALQSIAQTRSQKIVSSGVISHQLPELGTFHDMLLLNNISFMTGGENLAGDSTVTGAETSLEGDPSHLKNILDPAFNYIGIGIKDSPEFGKVFVQDFLGR